jgi:hypothetical protein
MDNRIVKLTLHPKQYQLNPNRIERIKEQVITEENIFSTRYEKLGKYLQDKTICPAIVSVENGKRVWKGQQVFIFDFNTGSFDEKVAPKQILDMCHKYKLGVGYLYYLDDAIDLSKHDTTLKFRVILCCSRLITSATERNAIMNAFFTLFPQCDMSCMAFDKVFFGRALGDIREVDCLCQPIDPERLIKGAEKQREAKDVT